MNHWLHINFKKLVPQINVKFQEISKKLKNKVKIVYIYTLRN